MATRQLRAVAVDANNWQACMSALNREIRKARIAETDVVSVQSDYDDGGVSARVFYWKK
jgi:hypothetical protein